MTSQLRTRAEDKDGVIVALIIEQETLVVLVATVNSFLSGAGQESYVNR